LTFYNLTGKLSVTQVRGAAAAAGAIAAVADRYRRNFPTETAAATTTATTTATSVPAERKEVHHRRTRAEFRHFRPVRDPAESTTVVAAAAGTAGAFQQQHPAVAPAAGRGRLATV